MKQLSEKLRAWARSIKRDGVTLWFAYRNPHTPMLAKAMSLLVVAYALSPIDLVPDFIPVLGYLDDVIVLPILIWLTVKFVPDHVLEESRVQAEEWMEREGRKPRSSLGIAFVISVWVAVCWVIWHYLVAPNLS